jgi:hypothetical protein
MPAARVDDRRAAPDARGPVEVEEAAAPVARDVLDHEVPGEALHLDVDTIDAVGLRQVSLYEPWVKKTTSFQGVWLADLLKVAGVPPSAAVVHLTALDDYKVDLTMADVAAGGIFLATKTGDGRSIPISDGGPTRIVFVGDVPSGRSADQWIWSLQTLDVQ